MEKFRGPNEIVRIGFLFLLLPSFRHGDLFGPFFSHGFLGASSAPSPFALPVSTAQEDLSHPRCSRSVERGKPMQPPLGFYRQLFSPSSFTYTETITCFMNYFFCCKMRFLCEWTVKVTIFISNCSWLQFLSK